MLVIARSGSRIARINPPAFQSEDAQTADDFMPRLTRILVDDDWVGHLLAADSILKMPEISIEVPLAQLYDGVDLTTPGDIAEQASG